MIELATTVYAKEGGRLVELRHRPDPLLARLDRTGPTERAVAAYVMRYGQIERWEDRP